MRLWSLHPKYLDSKGLVAVWREGLLAQKVLLGKTKGYKNHPQLNRFKNTKSPLQFIVLYLKEIYKEAEKRNYNFRLDKIETMPLIVKNPKLTLTTKQLGYEFEMLNKKLKIRDYKKYRLNYTLISKIKGTGYIEPHPLFEVIEGSIESWEVNNV